MACPQSLFAVSPHTPPETVRRILDPHTPGAEVGQLLQGLSDAEKTDVILRLAQAAHRQAQFVDIANRVSDSLSLDVLFPRLMEVVTEALGADRSSLFLHDPESGELFSRIMQGNVMDEVRFPSTVGIAGAVFASGRGRVIADVYADPLFNRDMDQRTGYRTRNLLCVPIRNRRQEVIGITQVLNKRAGDFDTSDLQLLEALSGQAASALENARNFEKVDRAQREEALLLEVVSSIASEIVLQPLLQKILDAATQLLDAERGSLFLHDPTGRELYSQVAGGASIEEIRFPSNAGIAGECFTAGAPVNIPDAYADARFNPEVDRQTGFKTRNMLCMPIATQHGSSVGVMQILNKRAGSFGRDDEKRLVALCAQAAISIENAQLFEQVKTAHNYNEGILRSMSNGVITMDAAFTVTKINQAATRILRATAVQLEGKTPREILGERNSWILGSLDKVRSTGKTDITVDTDLLLDSNEAVSINLTAVPLVTTQDNPIGYMLVIEDISREKRLRNTMSRYMSKAVVDQLLESGDAALAGVGREVSVLFSDIRGFTSRSETMPAEDIVQMLNAYFERMVEIVFEYEGTLDKFVGDEIMALFGAPVSHPDDPIRAVRAALAMLDDLRDFNAGREAQGLTTFEIGIGLNSGDVVAGYIGSSKAMQYTVIGAPVNLAARLCSAARGMQVLISETTWNSVREHFDVQELEPIKPKGIALPIRVFEVLRDRHKPTGPDVPAPPPA